VVAGEIAVVGETEDPRPVEQAFLLEAVEQPPELRFDCVTIP